MSHQCFCSGLRPVFAAPDMLQYSALHFCNSTVKFYSSALEQCLFLAVAKISNTCIRNSLCVTIMMQKNRM